MPAPPDTGVRPYLAAFLIATLAALVIDAVLQLALDAVRVSTYGGGAPWWITANLIERGRWVVFALFLWWLVPRLLATDPEQPIPIARASPANAWRHVAITIVAVPLLWIVATWAVSAVRFTLLGSWDTDGRVFLSAGYYRGLAMDLAAAAIMKLRQGNRLLNPGVEEPIAWKVVADRLGINVPETTDPMDWQSAAVSTQ